VCSPHLFYSLFRALRKSDEAIRAAVEDAFRFDPRVKSFKPTVQISEGVVTPWGQVVNLKAKKTAQQDAVNSRGVRIT